MKLIEHLILLSTAEREDFSAMAKTWYPQSKAALNFLSSLVHQLNQAENPLEIYRVYPGALSMYSKKSLQNMQTPIMKWFKRFLASNKYYSLNYPDAVAYINFCLDNQFNDRFVKKQRRRKVSAGDFSGPDNLRELYLTNYILYYHPLISEREKTNDPAFRKMALYFEAYQYVIRAEHLLESFARNTVFSGENLLDLEPRIPSHLAEYPLIKIYGVLVDSYSRLSPSLVMSARELVWDNLESFSDDQQIKFIHAIKNMYAHLIRSNKIDRQSVANYLFDCYKILDRKQSLLEGGKMQVRTFTNIINIAIKVKEYEWIASFIDRYGSSISTQTREEVIAVAKSGVLFSQKKFKQAILSLPTRSKDQLIDIRCKGLEICCMIELAMDEYAIEQKCKTLSAKLGRSSDVSKEILNATRCFLNVARKLNFKEKKKSEIESYFNSAKEIFFYDWLKEKIVAYKSNWN